jgi:predicted nuclease of predicted toxin-antitoxin system
MKGTSEFSEGLIIHKAISDVIYAADTFSVDGVLIACDSKNNWRKTVYPEYKGNRVPDEYASRMKTVMHEVRDFFKTCTSVPAISVDGAEADDVIAYAVAHTTENCIILSGDKDFIQLVDGDRVRLYAPILKLERTSTDPQYDLFEKCIRGDAGDNIFSAYPRVRSTKLQQAWENPVDMLNIMETVRKDGQIVKDVYQFNKQLIDLSMQPEHITESIKTALNSITESNQKYDFVKTLKFLGKWDLKNLPEAINKNHQFFQMTFL